MSCVWGRSGSVEGLRMSSASSRTMGFEMLVLNALVGTGKILRKKDRREGPK